MPSAQPSRRDRAEWSIFPSRSRYRLKRKLLGKPLVTERLSEERLSNVIALGVLAPDCISSTAYGTEEILTQLVPAVGVAAFACCCRSPSPSSRCCSSSRSRIERS
jgi:hypothetical protein